MNNLASYEEEPKWKLTIEELRKCRGFENINDEDAESVINSLVSLSRMFYELRKITE